jgi:hypothetical protein
MSIQLRGNSGTIAEVDANTRALRVNLRPDNVGSLGDFGVSLVSGTMGAGLGAGSSVFHFRWTSSTNLARIKSVRLWAGSIVAFAPGFFRFDLVIARSWTADGSGGTGVTISGNTGKKRTSFASTSVGSLRIATTGGLGAGTWSLDSQGIGSVGGSVTATAGDKLISPTGHLFDFDGTNYPIVLAQNEGLVLRATVPATGTWTFGVDVDWAELSSY